MALITTVVLVSVLSVSKAKITNIEEAKTYLKQYGYIKNDSLTDFETSLMDFQQQYNLFIDGELNNETLELMNRPRCVEGENSFLVRSKWNKTNLVWYFPQATEMYRELTKKAFSYWEKESNLRFSYVVRPLPIKPDITITLQSREHWMRANCQGKYKCSIIFDGPGAALAHAFHPNGDTCREIHMDLEENWYLGDGDTPKGQSSFLNTLVHEIGHVLGLGHSGDPSAIMYPWYQDRIISLSTDDKIAIQYLYGAPITKVVTTTVAPTTTSTTTLKSTRSKIILDNPNRTSREKLVTTTVASTTTSTTTLKSTRRKIILDNPNGHQEKNFCEIQQPDVMFLAYAPPFPNHRLYVIAKKLLWRLDIKSKKIPRESENIKTYLTKNFSEVTHVFQDTGGNLFVVDGNRFYSVSFPDLNIQQDVGFNLPAGSRINAVFQTNTGRNYVWYNNASFIEFSLGDFHVLDRGQVKDMFPGIPEDISSVFRYMDGHLYFIRQNIFYKYNEFTRELVEAGPFNWNVLGIPCPNKGLLDQLKSLLTKIVNLYT